MTKTNKIRKLLSASVKEQASKSEKARDTVQHRVLKQCDPCMYSDVCALKMYAKKESVHTTACVGEKESKSERERTS